MCVRTCVQYLLVMEFLAAFDLIILIVFHQVEEKLLSKNAMRDSINEVRSESNVDTTTHLPTTSIS
jgi:hypothetical protein